MTIKCQENVVELQITVDDAVLVEIFQRKANLSGIDSRSLALCYTQHIGNTY